jgi:hypothetical protein
MACPTLKFQLDVPSIERLRAQATEHGVSLTSWLQQIVLHHLWATPTDGDRKAESTEDGTPQ